jgi:hypothetical protein
MTGPFQRHRAPDSYEAYTIFNLSQRLLYDIDRRSGRVQRVFSDRQRLCQPCRWCLWLAPSPALILYLLSSRNPNDLLSLTFWCRFEGIQRKMSSKRWNAKTASKSAAYLQVQKPSDTNGYLTATEDHPTKH